jgi:predicted GIY-YIG superfamily endonuclease
MKLYILKLAEDNNFDQNFKYYIGISDIQEVRIQQHFNGIGSEWTKKYKPVEVIKIMDNIDVYDEDKITEEYMSKYGINNVRGGIYSQIILPEFLIKTLDLKLKSFKNACYKCGEKNHYIKNCPGNIKINNEIEFIDDSILLEKSMNATFGSNKFNDNIPILLNDVNKNVNIDIPFNPIQYSRDISILSNKINGSIIPRCCYIISIFLSLCIGYSICSVLNIKLN